VVSPGLVVSAAAKSALVVAAAELDEDAVAVPSVPVDALCGELLFGGQRAAEHGACPRAGIAASHGQCVPSLPDNPASQDVYRPSCKSGRVQKTS